MPNQQAAATTKDKDSSYRLLAGTSSGLLPRKQQQTTAGQLSSKYSQAPIRSSATSYAQLQAQKRSSTGGASTTSSTDRFSLRTHSSRDKGATRIPAPFQTQPQAQEDAPVPSTTSSPKRSSSSPARRSPSKQATQQQASSPLRHRTAPGSPTTSAHAASSPARLTSSSRPSTPQHVPYSAEQLLRAAQCQEPLVAAAGTISPCSSVSGPQSPSATAGASAAAAVESVGAVPQGWRHSAGGRPAGQCRSPGPQARPAAAVDLQQEQQQQQQQTQRQQRQTGALQEPLPHHAPADSQSTQQQARPPLPLHPQPWRQQQQHQEEPQQPSVLEQHPGTVWQQQQQDEHDAGAAVPEAEASFDFLVLRPGSRASVSTVDCGAAGGESVGCTARRQGQYVCSISEEELHGDQQQQQPLDCSQEQDCSQQCQQGREQQEQFQHACMQPVPDVSHAPDVSPQKQQQMLARLCAKHGLPLPHPRNLSRQQKQQQAKGGSLWDPGSKQQLQLGAKVTQRGGAVARRREELLQQLRHSSMARQRSKQGGGGGVPATPEAPAATRQQPVSAADLPARSPGPAAAAAAVAAAEAELLPDSSSQQQQMLQLAWAGGSAPPARPCTPASPAVSDLHLVDGLQYVHALLGSIKMPSLSAGAPPAAAAAAASGDGGSGLGQDPYTGSMQLWLPQQQQQERSSRTELGASDQQGQHLLRGANACQLHDLCCAALAKLRKASGSSGTAASAAAAAAAQQRSSSHHRADLPLRDALVLLCLTDSQQQQQQHQHQHQHHQRVQHQECFAALHAAAQQHVRAPPGDVRHQQLQPGWHKQQRQQLAQGLCWGARQLGIRAVAAVARAQQGWMLQELQPLQRCLRQVQQQLWRQQALAEAAAASGCLPGSPNKTKAAAACKGCSSPRMPGSPSWKPPAAAGAAREPTKTLSRLSPRGAVITPRTRAVQGHHAATTSPRKQQQPLAVTVVAKRLTAEALLRSTAADLTATCAGWEGSPVLCRLLADARDKLLARVCLWLLRIAATAAAQQEVLLCVQLPLALHPLTLSAAFAAWRAWSVDRSAARGLRQGFRDRVRMQRAAAVVCAWREAVQAASWLRARYQALMQQRRQLLLVRAFRAWRCARAQRQVDSVQQALAVLWHARVTSVRVLLAWAREARRASLLAAVAWADSTDDSSADTSRSTSSSACASGATHLCSRDLAAALQLQRPWRDRVLLAVADAYAGLAESLDAVETALAVHRAQLPPLLLSAQQLLQALHPQRPQQLGGNGERRPAEGRAAQARGQEEGRSRRPLPRAEWSMQLLADDSSSYVVCHSGLGSRRASLHSEEDGSCCHDTPGKPQQLSAACAAAPQPAAAAAAAGTSAGGFSSLPAAAAAAPAGLTRVGGQPGHTAGVTAPAGDGAGTVESDHEGGRIVEQVLQPAAAVEHLLQQQQQRLGVPAEVSHTLRAPAAVGVQQLLLGAPDPVRVQTGIPGAAAAEAAAAVVSTHASPPAAAAAAAASVPTAASAAGLQQCVQDSCSGAGPAAPSGSQGHTPTAAGAAAAAAAGVPVVCRSNTGGSLAASPVHAPLTVLDIGSHSTVEQQQQQQQQAGALQDAGRQQLLSSAGSPGVGGGQYPAAPAATAVAAAAAVAAAGGACRGQASPGAHQLSSGVVENQPPEGVTSRLQSRLRHRNATDTEAAGAAAGAAAAAGPAASGSHGQQPNSSSSSSTVGRARANLDSSDSSSNTDSSHESRPAAAAAEVLGGQQAATAEASLQQLAQQGQGLGQGQKHPAAVAAVAEGMPVAFQHQRPEQQEQQHADTAACTRAAAAAPNQEELLRSSLRHWLWMVRSKALLVRVFTGAEAAWQALDNLAAGCDSTYVRDYRLMRAAFQAWAGAAAQALQGAAALAAVEAAAAYHSSRLAVKAWRAWRQYLSQVPSVQQRYDSALASLCLLGWRQHALQQRTDPHSRLRLRQRLRAATGGRCKDARQFRRMVLLTRVWASWRALAHYRLRLLASALTGWQVAAEDTQQRLATFAQRWQHRRRLLTHALLLWRGLVLLLKQQRTEAAQAEAWHASRLASGVLSAWCAAASGGAAQRRAVAAAADRYATGLLRRKLLQWSLVVCASSAARVYHQHGLLARAVRGWRAASSSGRAAAGALLLEECPPTAAAAAAASSQQQVHQHQQPQVSRIHRLLPPELLPLPLSQHQMQGGQHQLCAERALHSDRSAAVALGSSSRAQDLGPAGLDYHPGANSFSSPGTLSGTPWSSRRAAVAAAAAWNNISAPGDLLPQGQQQQQGRAVAKCAASLWQTPRELSPRQQHQQQPQGHTAFGFAAPLASPRQQGQRRMGLTSGPAILAAAAAAAPGTGSPRLAINLHKQQGQGSTAGAAAGGGVAAQWHAASNGGSRQQRQAVGTQSTGGTAGGRGRGPAGVGGAAAAAASTRRRTAPAAAGHSGGAVVAGGGSSGGCVKAKPLVPGVVQRTSLH